MVDYSVEKYVISNDSELGYNELSDFDRVKVVYTE